MNDVNTALSSLQHWAVRAHRDGWIPDAVLDKVSAHKPHDPSALFADGAASPLVLAFFGGTGVGKSSLLNRLAGSPIAKSSAVRPTSREVTLYLHEDVALADLPAGIPVELTTVKRHQHPEHRDSLWIDTPDIDSVITTHRDQVLAWLPYIDLLVYVVSPERYRDDAGWDMLQANRHRHDWAFVMNHWDRGDPAQRDDFVQLLTNGGIESPHVFCTDCRDGGAADDDFEALTAYVASQSDALALAEARRRSERNERAAQDALRDTCLQALGSDADWAALGADLSATAKPFATQCLSDAIAPREQTLRGLFPDDPPPFWRQVLGAQDRAEVSAGTVALWSERSQERLRGRLDELMIRAAERGMPVAPLRRAMQPVAEDAEVDVNGQATQALAQALDQPGVALQRAALRVTDTLSKLLPICALAWVGWRVVQGFVSGATDEAAYLGLDFVINSVMLIGLSAVIPAVIATWLRPSPRLAAKRALESSVTEACASLDAALVERFNTVKSVRDSLVADAKS